MSEGIKGKKCPKCGHINDEIAMICAKGCPGGLSRITPQYHGQDKIQQEGTAEIATPQDIVPQVQIATVERPQATIRMPSQPLPKLYCESNPDFAVEIKNGDIIGREGSINVTSFPRSEYISRKHATFIYQGNNWLLKVEGKTNPTMVNFKQLSSGEIAPLKDNDRITLADTTFIFRSS
jgi:hypothetical protein